MSIGCQDMMFEGDRWQNYNKQQ